jgi:hypothetical protein
MAAAAAAAVVVMVVVVVVVEEVVQSSGLTRRASCARRSLPWLAQANYHSASWHGRTLISPSSEGEAESRTAPQAHVSEHAEAHSQALPLQTGARRRRHRLRQRQRHPPAQAALVSRKGLRTFPRRLRAFPSSSLAYIANLALLTTTIHRVWCLP